MGRCSQQEYERKRGDPCEIYSELKILPEKNGFRSFSNRFGAAAGLTANFAPAAITGAAEEQRASTSRISTA